MRDPVDSQPLISPSFGFSLLPCSIFYLFFVVLLWVGSLHDSKKRLFGNNHLVFMGGVIGVRRGADHGSSGGRDERNDCDWYRDAAHG